MTTIAAVIVVTVVVVVVTVVAVPAVLVHMSQVLHLRSMVEVVLASVMTS
jgi:hypothetical protein